VRVRFRWTLSALVCALGVALSPPLWARDKAASPIAKAEVAKYDNPRQAALLKKQVAELPPQQPGVTDIYVIGVAGWASEDVFRNELAGALKVLGNDLPLSGTVRLINSAETAKTIPLASRPNIAAAVRAVAGVMDREEDVLLIFMTSHGVKEGFGLQLPALLVRFSPEDFAAILKKAGIKNRVVIVSSCYSGIFVKPLANEDTIVLTASDAKSPSFGCANGREWTYFGDALFNHSLKPGTDFRHAYQSARKLIEEWEKREKLGPSSPQAHFGPAVMDKLAPAFAAKAQQ
jgi:Peptidase C13 family